MRALIAKIALMTRLVYQLVNKNFINLLNVKIKESYENIKIKGDLFFKIMLALGAVLTILIW